MAHNRINCYFTWDMLRSIDLQCFCGQPSKLEEVRCSRGICTRALGGFLEGQGVYHWRQLSECKAVWTGSWSDVGSLQCSGAGDTGNKAGEETAQLLLVVGGTAGRQLVTQSSMTQMALTPTRSAFLCNVHSHSELTSKLGAPEMGWEETFLYLVYSVCVCV